MEAGAGDMKSFRRRQRSHIASNNLFVHQLLFLIFLVFQVRPSAGNSDMFPKVTVTLANDSDNDVLYLCKDRDFRVIGDEGMDQLRVLPKKQRETFNFTQTLFQMRWCYLYINDQSNGFFWAYTVKQKCTRCFWSIRNDPYLYRPDANKWERQKLFPPIALKNNLLKTSS